MAKTKVQPPPAPNVKGMREAEKQIQASMAPADEETSEASSVDQIRAHLHDSIQSAATALNLLDDLEARG
jgi:hypothetical protein